MLIKAEVIDQKKNLVQIPQPITYIVDKLIYEVDEVFPWRGTSVIFSVFAPMSLNDFPSYESDFWLDSRCLGKFMVHMNHKRYKSPWGNDACK